jgi:hypothetical protein
VVVKTTEEDQLIADLTETFTNLREFQWKLNPTKCVFGVPSGLLLGFMVGHRGLEANPAKVDAIRNMAKPSNKKVKDRLGDQRGGSEWEPIKILLERD